MQGLYGAGITGGDGSRPGCAALVTSAGKGYGKVNMTKKEQRMVETRIIEPCLEWMEKIAWANDRGRDYTAFINEKREELRERLLTERKLILPRLVVIVTTKCTLRCRHCSNLMPHYEHPWDLDIRAWRADMRQLFSIVDGIVDINVLGGEPFLYPWLAEVLEELLGNEKIRSIDITTNATKIPQQRVLQLLGDPKITVEISDYGRIDLLSQFIQAMDRYHVRLHIAVNMKWVDCGGCSPRNRDRLTLREIYQSCNAGLLCKALFKGKIFDCPRAAHLFDLGYAPNIAYADIYRCTKEELRLFWTKEDTMACDYCDMEGKEKTYVEPAVQMDGRHMLRSSCTMIPREDYEELWGANEWYRGQLSNYKQRARELEAWTKELQTAKDWLEAQYLLQKERADRLEKGQNMAGGA